MGQSVKLSEKSITSLHLSSICKKRLHRTRTGPLSQPATSSPRHLSAEQQVACWLSDGRSMLTCCPKCHHLLTTSPAADSCGTLAVGGNCTTLQLQQPDAADLRPTAITVRVPGWTTGGGSVVLQTAPPALATGGIKVATGEPSPSAPLSFVLPTTPTVILAAPGGQQWSFLVTPSPPPPPTPTPTQSAPPPPHSHNPRLQSDLDLRTLAATQTALRNSGWYYEGLSWQESANLLMPTTPGTFLVRDSSDPRYLFSLSVQTDRGPTSVRLHYADGHFRLDAETKIIPLMPLFDCVVKLVQHYAQLTADKVGQCDKNRGAKNLSHFVANMKCSTTNFVAKCPTDFLRNNVDVNLSGVSSSLINVSDATKNASKTTRRKRSSARDQVWIDSTGQVYSHILLTAPLRQKDRFPSLMHLSRLAVNRLKTATNVPIGGSLPLSLQTYLRDYPYIC